MHFENSDECGCAGRSFVKTWRVENMSFAKPPIPEDEAERLAALMATGLLDSAPENDFDRLTVLAAAI